MLKSFAALFPLTLALAALSTHAADDYKLGPDSQFKTDVPHGRLERFQLTNSTVFPGTIRDGGVYIPAQYDPSKPAALMVFQDGIGYLTTNGSWRVPWVFDNLIAAEEMLAISGAGTLIVSCVASTNVVARGEALQFT